MADLHDIKGGKDWSQGRPADTETVERAYVLFRDLSLKQAA
ncbi:hypothetical protein [Mesorhizobium sp. IMUNJ 23232]